MYIKNWHALDQRPYFELISLSLHISLHLWGSRSLHSERSVTVTERITYFLQSRHSRLPLYPRYSLHRKPEGILWMRQQQMQTSGLDLAILGCSHTDFQDNVMYSQYAFLRFVAWLYKCWGKTLLFYSVMCFLDPFPLITDITAGRKKNVDEGSILSPNTRSKSCLFKGVVFKIWEKNIVEAMHHSGNNITAKLGSQQNLTQL